jgi:undecaprenol kinase
MALRVNKPDYNQTKVPKWKNSNIFSSLEFAWTGIVTAIKEERNMRKHLVLGAIVVICGLLFRVSTIEWLFLFLAIFLVVMAEMINSAIENVVDLATDYHFHLLAKKAKDMAAGAVLWISGYAAITGLIIFVPKTLALLMTLLK